MNSLQLKKILKSSDCLQRRRVILEITAINALPLCIKKKHFPQVFIVNTDPYPNPGKHWLCIIFSNSNDAEYFDSLGRSPSFYGFNLTNFISRNSRNIRMLLKKIQHSDSNLCGLYVLFFIFTRLCHHVSFYTLYDMFDSVLKNNDQLMNLYFNRFYL